MPSDLENKIAAIARAAEERDAERRAKTQNLPYADLKKTPVSIEAVKLISEEEAKAGKMIGVQRADKDLAIAAYNPALPETKKILDRLTTEGYAVKVFVASLSGISEAWHFYEFVSGKAKSITGRVELSDERLAELTKKLTTVAAAREELAATDLAHITTTALLEVILAGALATRASDIHVEAEEKSARIRYRLDGVLHDVAPALPRKNYETLISRLKLLSNMKINVHGEAQDGRFTIGESGRQIEMRVSVIPSEFGETVVMRVLNPDAINVTLGELGLRPDDMALVEGELKKPNGLILNTGPTGSGKTTTLYAFLRKLANPEMKVITVEDPIEYHLGGIEQTQVNTEVGYTFAKGLRAIVRQDPDVILVGEIRDFETADIALEASLTGHLVLSTLHTNDAVGTIPRLVNLGVKAESIGPALSLIIAQRLARKLCETCKTPADISEEDKIKFDKFIAALPARVDRSPYSVPKVFKAVGCEACDGIGYKGRVAILEFFKGGPELEQLILKRVAEPELRTLAVKQGMVTMQEDGILKVLSGVTTFEEVESVTGAISWK